MVHDAGEALNRPGPYPLTLAGITNRMVSNDDTEQLLAFREALEIQDQKHSIMTRVSEYYGESHWKTRIHAELALLELLYDCRCRFFDDDRYIACSKASCFCCYHYICQHPGSFIAPSSHNKIYLNWSPPNVTRDVSGVRYVQQRDIMNKVTAQIRRAVIDRTLATHGRLRWHPDSSTGITLTVKASSTHFSAQRSQENICAVQDLAGGFADSVQISDSESSEDGGVPVI
jgi:hypothetical protein